MTHNSTITRNTPSAFMFLLDISGSMSETINFDGETMSKNDALNKIVNSSLQEIIFRCKHFNQYYNYFDIAVLGYQNGEVNNLLEQHTQNEGFSTINEIVSCEIDTKVYDYLRKKPNGEKFISQRTINQYINTEPYGTTPMYKALDRAYYLLQRWVLDHKGKNCFPPIVINITDGEANDATPSEMKQISQKLMRLSTENGNILLFNIHLTNQDDEKEIVFPTDKEELPDIRNTKLLYDMSSTLPESFQEQLQNLYPNTHYDKLNMPKAMCYNTSLSSLIKILEIGSLSKSFIK